MGYHEGLRGYLVLKSSEAQAAITCHNHLQSATGDRARRSPTITNSTAPTSSWWLYQYLVLHVVLVGQPGSVSRAVSVSGLDLLLAWTEAQLLSNFEAMLSHCCPLR